MLSITPPTMRREWFADILVLSAVLLIFYLFWLGNYPLFTPDEGRYSEVAREMVATGDYITPRVDGVAFLDKPALYYWLQAIAINLFGIKEWALRLFPALLGVFGCLLTYISGRCLFNRRTGMLAAIMLATTPLYFGGAHYADLNLEVAVFISCSLLFFIMSDKYQGTIRACLLLLSYLCAAFAFLTKGLIGVAFPAMIAGTWILCLGRWEILKKAHFISGILLFLILILPWYVLVQKANPEFLHYFFVTQQVTRFLSEGDFNNKTPAWFYAPVILAGFIPWTIFLFQALSSVIKKIWQARHQHQSELFLLLWIIIIFTFFSIPQSKTLGYIFPLLPALALLIANYLSTIWDNARRKAIHWSMFLFLCINIGLAYLLLVLPSNKNIDFPPDFTLYSYTIAGILLISAVIVFLLFLINKKTLLSLFIVCTACNVAGLLVVTLGAKHLNRTSTKSLVTHLKPILKPDDEIVNYYKFYQDLPIYLEKRITLVANWKARDIAKNDNWVRELWYGMPFQKTDQWLISEKKFWERWNNPDHKRIFVFVNNNFVAQFKTHTKKYYLIRSHQDVYLFSNQARKQHRRNGKLTENPHLAGNKSENGQDS